VFSSRRSPSLPALTIPRLQVSDLELPQLVLLADLVDKEPRHPDEDEQDDQYDY
jgi:hypothetical protein